MALKDTWKDLEDAVVGVPDSGSDISVEPINVIAHAVIENEKNKVDKKEGKELSSNDYTDKEKQKLADLKNYDDTPVKNNTSKIDLLNKYGTTDVYVLQESVDYITDETGTQITAPVNGKELNYIGQTVTVPEGITSMTLDEPPDFAYLINCDTFICPSSLIFIDIACVNAKKFILNDNIERICLDSDTDAYPQTVEIKLTNSSTTIEGYELNGNIIAPANIDKICVGFGYFQGSIYVYNPKATIYCNIDFDEEIDKKQIKIHGYAGSTAEKYAKENGYTFVNMGSDYTKEIEKLENDKVDKDNVSNALKGTSSGEAIGITDISPIEHNMAVRVSGVENLSAVKLYKQGKNWFNTKTITKKIETTVAVDGISYEVYDINGYTNDYLYATNSSFLFNVNMKKEKTYTVSLIWMGSSNGRNEVGRLYMPFKDVKGNNQCFKLYTSNEELNPFGITQTTVATPLKRVSLKITPTEDIAKGALCFYSYGVSGYVLKDSIQIEEGTAITDYEPGIEPTVYDVKADGTVEGVTSLYPNTTLYTDTQGTLIECEYNRDINKAFAELQNAIISLGGDV